MRITDEKRREIEAWANQRAHDDFIKHYTGKKVTDEQFEDYIREQTWRYEKAAYWKLHKQAQGVRDERDIYKR